MWLLTSVIAAVIATAAWIFSRKKHRLGSLALMCWGLSIMVFVDHVLGYEGGEFLEMRTSGLIGSGLALGIAMLVPVIIAWEIPLIVSKIKEAGG